MQYLIGIDIGTQGTKGNLFDEQMRSAGAAFEESNLISPAPGVTWQEPEEIFTSVVKVIRRLLEENGIRGAEVAGIGIDSQMAGIMGIDEEGEATTPYDSWLDNRCSGYVKEMRARAGDRITEITGGPVTCTHGPKILWWKQEHPEAYGRTAKFVLPHTYVVGKITGLKASETYFDYTCLQYSGFGDNRKKEWSEELLELFQVEKSKLPRIVSPFEKVGKVTKEFAAASGLLEGTPVVAGAGDTSASIFGAGMLEKNQMLDCAGTASVLCSVVDEYVPDVKHQTLTMMRSPVDGFWFPLAYINGGGLCVRWIRDKLTSRPPLSYQELERKAEQVAPGSEGLIFVPHFAGRILPNNPDLKGSFTGLNWNHGVGHMYRAVMEGIAYEYAFYKSILKELYQDQEFPRVYAIGGGAQSDLFLQIKADVLGADLIPFRAGDTALVGSAVIAGVGTGLFSDYRQPIHQVMEQRREIRWNRENHKLYQKNIDTYLKTIDALTEIYQQEERR